MSHRVVRTVLIACLVMAIGGFPVRSASAGAQSVEVLLTDPNGSARLVKSSVSLHVGTSPFPLTVEVEPRTKFQSIQGFGASFTDSSAWLISQFLSPPRRAQLMSDLFDPDSGIGMSMLRQPMGATDFNAPTSGLYTFDDQPCGSTDPSLEDFSVAHDEAYILPLLRQALSVGSDITVMATPWSPPAWMRDGACSTLGTIGGPFKPEFYGAYAQYFVKFVEAYESAGVPISYVTPQNEPTNELILLPSMNFPVEQEATFVSQHLGPALAAAGLDTKILGWDYVWDQASKYPTQLLKNDAARAAIAGTAWHCYGTGTPDEMTPIHELAPDKDIFVTECSGLMSNPPSEPIRTDADQFKKTMNLFVDSTRNWARSVILWNIALDSFNGPSNGCAICRPLVHIDYSLFDGWVASPQIEYYAMGQVAKWVRPGAIRVASTLSGSAINQVTFKNTDGSKVLVAVNNGSQAETFGVQQGAKFFSYTLAPGAGATFRWF